MIDQRVPSLSRNLREQGYVDNDPDATLAAIRLIALADALEAQESDASMRRRAETIQVPTRPRPGEGRDERGASER